MTTDAPDIPVSSRNQNIGTVVITVLPFLGLLAAVTMSWNEAVGLTDLMLFLGLYVICGFGITIGYHRMLTHRAFEAIAPLKAALLVAGSLAIQGAAIDWAVDHRTHHAFSDKEGDPHSPHHGFSSSVWGRLQGLGHAHVGWLFDHNRIDQERYAKDLLQDRMVVTISRLFPLWILLSFAIPFALGGAITRTWTGAFTGLVWGGLVRLFFNHHVTWSVNSICHVFGRRPFTANDLSTNNWLLALPSLGEAWHHNHHVFPTSAFHGLGWRQVDLSGIVIAAWEKLGLVRNVRRPSAEQIGRKRTAAAGA
ncbi:MAG TPA: acyl-CoA desaturase [Gaiellales bacterium]|jgi:stearoyl-CoA desaturase (Delta-9 desaturase)|nr:acyl-CoA desaturase [Gaiellales bacterium]